MNEAKKHANRTVMSRRDFLRMAAGAAGTLTLAACAPASTPAPESKVTTAAEVEKVVLTFWTPGGSQIFCPAMWEDVINAYKTTNPNVDFNEIQCGAGEQRFQEVLLARIAAGNPPDVTIYWDSSPIPLGARGSLEPLDELMPASQHSQVENWPEGVLASCRFNGKTYGLPAVAASFAIYYNQEMFEEHGIPSDRASFPKTWDELRALSKQFTRWEGDQLEIAGFIPGLLRPWEVEMFPVWAALNGSQAFDAEQQRYTIDAEPNIAMMAYWLDWLDDEYKGDVQKVLDSRHWDAYPGEQARPPAFQEGLLAMLPQGSNVMGDFYQVEPKLEKWDVADFPVGPNGKEVNSGVWPSWVVIPKGSKHKEEAFKWLDYVVYEGAQVWFTTIGDLPVNKKVPRDKLVNETLAERRGEEVAKDMTRFMLRQLDISTSMWTDPVHDVFSDQLSRALDRIMRKIAKPEEALAEAQKACQDELEKFLSPS